MARSVIASGFLLIAFALAAADTSKAAPQIDLSEPGQLEAIERYNPGHYWKIRRILIEIEGHLTEDVPSWMQVTFEAREVSYTNLLMISDPPKKRLAFTLDETAYVVVVTLTNPKRRILPARIVPAD